MLEIRWTGRNTLLAGVAAGAIAAAAPAAAQNSIIDNGRTYSFEFEGRITWLRGTSQPWAAFVTAELAGASVRSLETVRPDREIGGRIQFGMRLDGPLDLSLAYTGLTSNRKNSSINAPYQNNGAFYFSPILGAVRYIIGGTYFGDGSVTTRRQMHVGDFDVGYNVGLGSRAAIRLFGGARIAHWSQNTDTLFNAHYDPTIQVFRLTEQHRATYFGAGPRLGASGKWNLFEIGSGQVMLFGAIAGSVLFGNSSTRTTTNLTIFNNAFINTPQLTDTQTNSHFRVVYNAEGNVALGYRFDIGPTTITLRGGYRFDGWWNMVNTTGRSGAIVAGCLNLNCATPSLAGQFGSKGGYAISHGPFGVLTFEF